MGRLTNGQQDGNTYDEGGMIREIINVTNACRKNGLVGKNGCEGVQIIR